MLGLAYSSQRKASIGGNQAGQSDDEGLDATDLYLSILIMGITLYGAWRLWKLVRRPSKSERCCPPCILFVLSQHLYSMLQFSKGTAGWGSIATI